MTEPRLHTSAGTREATRVFSIFLFLGTLLFAGCGGQTTYRTNTKLRGESTTASEGTGQVEVAGACAEDSDCVTGACVSANGQKTCADRCAEDIPCKNGLACKKKDPRKTDSPLVCVTNDVRSCQACTSDSQCGDIGNACVQSPDGKLCGIDCTAAGDGVCPKGTMCIPLRDAEGTELSRQCIPNAGACKTVAPVPTCSGAGCGSNVGPSGSTGSTGTSGTTGTTGPSGSACVPSAEVCDGKDNDCDGKKDEGADGLALVQPCGSGVGQCVGTQTCTAGAWGACSAPQPTTETCNGKDDNCDGTVDEGLLSSVDSCGTCGNVCPGPSNAGTARSCVAQGNSFVCGAQVCKSVSQNAGGWQWYDHYYDNNNNPADGCEAVENNYNRDDAHAQAPAVVCDVDDNNNNYCSYTGYFLADNKTHETAPTARSAPQGTTNALDWYKVYAIDRAGADLRLATRLDVSFLPAGNLYEVCLSKDEDAPGNMDASCGARPPTNPNWWCSGMCCCAYGGNRVWTGLLDDEWGWDDGTYYARVKWISGNFQAPASGNYYSLRICDDSGTKNCQL
ncbi:MAG: hypothetical protein IT381_21690 [Deltaproteobacteria bacterium]|nr:hypothetical protein [Deltaproteobacteria bacterium]